MKQGRHELPHTSLQIPATDQMDLVTAEIATRGEKEKEHAAAMTSHVSVCWGEDNTVRVCLDGCGGGLSSITGQTLVCRGGGVGGGV